jgi:hypothetical protein
MEGLFLDGADLYWAGGGNEDQLRSESTCDVRVGNERMKSLLGRFDVMRVLGTRVKMGRKSEVRVFP